MYMYRIYPPSSFLNPCWVQWDFWVSLGSTWTCSFPIPGGPPAGGRRWRSTSRAPPASSSLHGCFASLCPLCFASPTFCRCPLSIRRMQNRYNSKAYKTLFKSSSSSYDFHLFWRPPFFQANLLGFTELCPMGCWILGSGLLGPLLASLCYIYLPCCKSLCHSWVAFCMFMGT